MGINDPEMTSIEENKQDFIDNTAPKNISELRNFLGQCLAVGIYTKLCTPDEENNRKPRNLKCELDE